MSDAVRDALSNAVISGLATAFRPSYIVAADELPKTRNMKAMRRVIRALAAGNDADDLSSLVNPESITPLLGRLRAAGIRASVSTERQLMFRLSAVHLFD